MRALVLEDWGKLVVAERPDPVALLDDVVLQMYATGICGSDIHGFTGETGRRKIGQVMGHETVGRILGFGDSVDSALGLEVGMVATINPVLNCGKCEQCRRGNEQSCAERRVIGVEPDIAAAFAEQMVVPARNVVLLPASMPIEIGALIEPLAVGYHAIVRGRLSTNDRVLILGGGPIGQACALAAMRAKVPALLVSEPRPERRRLVESLGIATICPVELSRMENVVGEALGAAPTVVIDAVGSAGTLETAFAVAPPGATIVLVGMGQAEVPLRAYEVSTRERTIVGSFCYTRAEFEATAAWVGSGPEVLNRLIEGRVSLDRAPETFAELARGDNPASKVLVILGA